MVMGKEVHVLPGAVTLRSGVMAIEMVVFVFGSVGSLVGTVSGHFLIHQLAIQFLFRSMRIPGRCLEGALPGPSRCVCGPTVCDLKVLCSLECRVT